MSGRSKRIDHVLLSSAHVSGVGGVQVVLRNIVQGLERSGRRVTFVCDRALPGVGMVRSTNALGCRTFGCAMPASVRGSAVLSALIFVAYAPLAFFHLARLIRRERIDVINGHYVDLYFVHLAIAARLLRVPFVVSVHGADVDAYASASRIDRLFYRLIMRNATRVAACSEALARQCVALFPGLAGRVTFVHNGLDLTRRIDATTPAPQPFVLSVCRHVHKKGVDVLLQAFVQVAAQEPDASLVLVGDGPLLDEHKRLAHALGIDDRVRFVGDVPHREVDAFFNACTMFVLASRAEPFGMVLLEAARCQKAIVATRVGGVPEILTDEVDGVLVEPDDPDALAAQIVRLLRDPLLASCLGSRAHHTLRTRFLLKDRVQDYFALFASAQRGPELESHR